ncbi:hypothetical protein KUCAC02_030466, partial [Chaenocephalus aceratus]
KSLEAEGYGESPSDCAQGLQLIPSPHRIGSPPVDPPHNRTIPQCIDFCHFLPNPDGISAGREDLLEPAERRLPVRGRAETPPYIPLCFMLQELFFDATLPQLLTMQLAAAEPCVGDIQLWMVTDAQEVTGTTVVTQLGQLLRSVISAQRSGECAAGR